MKSGFEFAGLKINKTRFIAHYAAEGCPWRIHASTIFDKKTIKVMCSTAAVYDLFVTFFDMLMTCLTCLCR